MPRMDTYPSRPYRAADFPRLLALVAADMAASRTRPYPAYWHPGYLWWQLFRADYDPAAHIHVWENASSELVAFTKRDRSEDVDFGLHPQAADDAALTAVMLDWIEAHGSDGGPLTTCAADGDAARRALLSRRGYTRGPHDWLHMRLELTRHVPATPPTDAVIRPVADGEIAARVALHHAVWPGSRVTEASYARMRAVPGYDPALDLVAVLPDGTLAAYCICWPDPVSGVGLFEPVGTHPEHRRRGYAAAVIAAANRRLRDAGMHTALVEPTTKNPDAVALYEAAGFGIAHRTGTYTRRT